MPGFLEKLPQRSLQRLFILLVFTLCDRPRAEILVFPERTSRMDKQNFQPTVSSAIGQDTRAFLTHTCLTGNPRSFSAETFISIALRNLGVQVGEERSAANRLH
jgi:hypothetical protein